MLQYMRDACMCLREGKDTLVRGPRVGKEKKHTFKGNESK